MHHLYNTTGNGYKYEILNLQHLFAKFMHKHGGFLLIQHHQVGHFNNVHVINNSGPIVYHAATAAAAADILREVTT